MALTATVTSLPESRARVDVVVEPAEVERAVDAAARSMAAGMKMPGFRKGKVPAPVVISRVGREAVLDEAVRERLAKWYVAAIGEAAISPVGDPDISLGELPGAGEPFTFAIEIGVRPVAKLGEWRGLEVARREAEADEDAVTAQLEELRDRLARLETVERAAASGDFVVMDYAGEIDGEPIDGGSARDQLVELGSGRLIPGFEEGLTGASAGDERTLNLSFPADYGAEHLAGREAVFAVTVKEVKEKRLPELDDDFAGDTAGFDTLEELREDIRSRMRESDEARAEAEYREAALDAAVAAATIDVPDALVEARAQEAFERLLHSLSHRGISKDAYLRLTQKTEQEVLEEAKPDAAQSLKREAVLAALIEAEGIDPTDEQIAEALEESVEPDESGKRADPAEMVETLRKNGRLGDVREDVASRMALDALIAAATPIDPGRAAAREKLWTPGS
jgi:trigger factor